MLGDGGWVVGDGRKGVREEGGRQIDEVIGSVVVVDVVRY